jgi:transcriptional regulator with XRE-family HTH domain
MVKSPLRIIVGHKVKALRKNLNLSQEAFADKCGFARSYMSRIERGKANLSLDAVEIIAIALNVEESKLLER